MVFVNHDRVGRTVGNVTNSRRENTRNKEDSFILVQLAACSCGVAVHFARSARRPGVAGMLADRVFGRRI